MSSPAADPPALPFSLDITGCARATGGIERSALLALLDEAADLPALVHQEQAETGEHAFLEVARMEQDAAAAAAFAAEVRPRYRRMVQCGIGGSTMGTRAVHGALPGDRDVVVLDSVDPRAIRALGSLEGTLVHVCTKSGETAETWALFAVLRERLEALHGEAWTEHVVATTGPETGALRQLTDQLGLRAFALPDALGGRFSYLSPVGLLAFAFQGGDAAALVRGAAAAIARDQAPGSPALAYGVLLAAFHERARRQSVFWPYTEALMGIGLWWQQLLAESLGKTRGGERAGILPIPVLGPRDQHSVHQLFMEGPDDRWFTFLEVDDKDDVTIPVVPGLPGLDYLSGRGLSELARTELRGTAHALLAAGRPLCRFALRRLDAETVGALLMTLMLSVIYAGKRLGVNPYGQPGVEAGKRATFALLGRAGYAGREKIEAALEADPRLCFD